MIDKDTLNALEILLNDIALNKNHPVIESRAAEWILAFLRGKVTNDPCQ